TGFGSMPKDEKGRLIFDIAFQKGICTWAGYVPSGSVWQTCCCLAPAACATARCQITDKTGLSANHARCSWQTRGKNAAAAVPWCRPVMASAPPTAHGASICDFHLTG